MDEADCVIFKGIVEGFAMKVMNIDVSTLPFWFYKNVKKKALHVSSSAFTCLTHPNAHFLSYFTHLLFLLSPLLP